MKRVGYGLLKLKPDELFALSPIEFFDMKYAYEHRRAVESDDDNFRTAWLITAVLNASEKVSKKVQLDKVYKRQFDDDEELIEKPKKEDKLTVITPEEKARLEAELLAKFNN